MAMQEVKQKLSTGINRYSEIIGSSTSTVECYVCGKGLQDGHSIIAKTLPSGIVLFCDIHCPNN